MLVALLAVMGAAADVACDAVVYVSDPDPGPANLRDGPGIGRAVVAQIPKDEGGVILHVVAAADGWLEVDRATGVTSGVMPGKSGWISGNIARVGVRAGGDYGARTVDLRATPSSTAEAVAHVSAVPAAKVRDCVGSWLLIDAGDWKGWLAPGDQCGNPATTCP